MPSSKHYFKYTSAVFDFLNDKDKERLGHLWKGYEQVFAATYQKWLEGDLNTSINTIQPFTTERWLPYDFEASKLIKRPATFTSNQDISGGVNLSLRWLLRFRINGVDEFEVDIRGPNPATTTINQIISRINNAVGFRFARGVFENTILQFNTRMLIPDASIEILPATIPLRDASEFVLGLLPADLPQRFPEFPFTYPTGYSDIQIAEIPTMQNKIRDDNAPTILASGVDYSFDRVTQTISFKSEQATSLWARRTFVDQETPWNNYGFLMDIYQPNTQGYSNVLKGLWFAFWNGPRPELIKRGLYLLFGLPVSPFAGTISSVTPNSISITSVTGQISEFVIPPGLLAIVTVGQEVDQFQPLTDGINVFDKINRAGFIENEIGRAGIERFLLNDATRGLAPDTDESRALIMLEENTFLPQISVESFISPEINMGNVRRFLDDIQPLIKAYLFQVIVGEFTDILKIKEKLTLAIELDVTPNLDYNQTTFLLPSILSDYELFPELHPELNLDSDIVKIEEIVEIEVNDVNGPVETFIA
jgi:hypothetical protein